MILQKAATPSDDEDEEEEPDNELALAMGFSGFGAKPGEKRKYNSNDGFVDPSISRPQATGANTVRAEKSSKLPAKPPNGPRNEEENRSMSYKKDPSKANL